jgi:uncharacterized protein
MRWIGRRESSNVEDMREGGTPIDDGSQGGSDNRNSFGRSRNSLPISGKARIVLFVIMAGIALASGVDPGTVIQQGIGLASSMSNDAPTDNNASNSPLQNMYKGTAANDNRPPADAARHFVGVVLADTEDVWKTIFTERGQNYVMPKMILFSGQTQSGCGFASAAMGPFYCPVDEKVYIDLDFFIELQNSLGASGDFAQAYVIAHEIGHHVQQLLGTMDKVDRLKGRMPEKAANALGVRVELQADCYAGIWAKRTAQLHNSLEAGDIDEAMNAASAVGDDRLQKQSQGYVVPDSFTHGSAQQRKNWFNKGYENGNLESCDTFSGS